MVQTPLRCIYVSEDHLVFPIRQIAKSPITAIHLSHHPPQVIVRGGSLEICIPKIIIPSQLTIFLRIGSLEWKDSLIPSSVVSQHFC